MDVQAGFSLRWVLISEGTFSRVMALFTLCGIDRANQSLRELRKVEKGHAIKVIPSISFNKKAGSPVSILRKSTAVRYRPVRVADGPITVRCRFIKNASWVYA